MTLYTGDNFLFEEIRLDTFPAHVSERGELARRGFIYVEGEYKCCFCPDQNHNIASEEDGGEREDQHYHHHQHQPALGVGNILIDYKNQLHPPSFLYGYVPVHYYSKSIGFARIRCHIQPSYINYARLEKRIDSFVSRTQSIPRGLAEAGFFYTGNGMTCCYHCGIVMHNWEPDDDPWMKHIYWYLECYHILLVKGLDYVSHQTVFMPYIPDLPKMALLGHMVQSLMLPKKLTEEMKYPKNEVCKVYLNC